MIVSDAAVKNRISVVVLAIMILVFGTYCYLTLPRESEPDISIPYVFVSTTYKGVSSADMEISVTIPIEKKLKGLDGVKTISSVSAEGSSQINIEFDPEIDIDTALRKVKDKVDEAKQDLPSDLENDPSVYEVNFSELPVIVLSLSGTCGPARLKNIADDLEEEIESIPGVLEVNVTGGREREIRIEVDPDKLAYYRIPITAFQQVVYSENQNTSGGSITLGSGRFQLRVPGEFSTPEEILGLVVSTHAGQPVYLKDVATVVDGFKEETSRARLDGHDAVNLAVKKRSGENIIRITDEIDAMLKGASLGWPSGTRITKLMDKAKDTRLMVADLENNILSGLILVVVVLMFALGIRNALLVSLAIPFSMLLSFIILYALDITLNNMVLFSLTLALGMVVDNAIVIIENIYRYMQQGVPRIAAAMRATSEVAYPVIGSTFTTLAAFFPLLFWKGVMGEFMRYLPITLVITLFSSLMVALVINPALTAIFVRVRRPGKSSAAMSAEEVAACGEKPVAMTGPLLRLYSHFLEGALRHRPSVILTAIFILVLMFQSWLLVVGLKTPVEFFPDLDPKSAYVNIEPPEGADLDYVDRIARKIEMAVNGFTAAADNPFPVDRYPEVYRSRSHKKARGEEFQGPGDLDNIEHVYAKTVKSAGSSAFEDNAANHIGLQFLDMKDRVESSATTLETVRQRVAGIPGAEITISKAQEGPPTGAPINIEISGSDFRVLGRIAADVRKIIARIPFVEDIQDNYDQGIPSVKVHVDRQRAAMFGLSTDGIGFSLKTAYNGLDVSTYHEGDEDFDILVKLPPGDLLTSDALNKLMIPAANGQLVPLTSLATIEYTGGIGDILRIDHQRTVTVKANVDETRTAGPEARRQAEELLAGYPIPTGYHYNSPGKTNSSRRPRTFLEKAFVIALFLIFLILVTLFNSVSQPLIILSSVVLSLGGAFLGLLVLKLPFGIIMSGLGVFSLAGVVVNNAIVLIDYTNKLRERGMALVEAVVAAGATRLRPVLLTAITTILGLLPMVTGVSYDFQLATFLTLVVVPVLYSLFDSMQHWSGHVRSWMRRIYWKPFGGPEAADQG
jgi:multidrug efflux pump